MAEFVSKESRDTTTDFTSQISDNLGSRIADGSFGEVYRCIVRPSIGTTQEVAVKVFKTDPRRTMEKLTNAMLREFKVWLKLKHPNIVPLLGTARVDSPLLALVSQWMSSGTLFDYLREQAITITPSARIELVKGITEGLNYLHSEGVIHGDLHPGNVLIDGSGNPCLGDFGLATVAEDPELQWTTTTMGRSFSSRWRAPEVLGINCDPGRPTFKSDIYSFGSVMFFVISGDIPWKGRNSCQISIRLFERVTHERPHNIFDYHWDLIQECWSWEPGPRPEAEIVLNRVQVMAAEYLWAIVDNSESISQQGMHPDMYRNTTRVVTRPWASGACIRQALTAPVLESQLNLYHPIQVPHQYPIIGHISETPPSPMLTCMWNAGHGTCGASVSADTIWMHFASYHLSSELACSTSTSCYWQGCNGRLIRRDNFTRHVREVHLGTGRRSRNRNCL